MTYVYPKFGDIRPDFCTERTTVSVQKNRPGWNLSKYAMTWHATHQELSYYISFVSYEMKTFEGVAKPHQTDGRADRQTEQNIPWHGDNNIIFNCFKAKLCFTMVIFKCDQTHLSRQSQSRTCCTVMPHLRASSSFASSDGYGFDRCE